MQVTIAGNKTANSEVPLVCLLLLTRYHYSLNQMGSAHAHGCKCACAWGQLNEGGSFDRQLVCGAAIDSLCACVCSTALGEFHAPWATWQSTSDRELLISTEARRLALWKEGRGGNVTALAERREEEKGEKRGKRYKIHKGLLRGLLQVNVATAHFFSVVFWKGPEQWCCHLLFDCGDSRG